MFEDFKDVFAWEHEDLKGVDPKVCQHRIPLIPDAKPVRLQRYRMNPNYAKKVKEEIDNLLKAGFIAEVESSDWLFPIVVVPKKNGKLRVCVDYRKLNAQIVKDPFPLPFTDMMLDEVAGHQMYNFMDGYSGYNQLALALEDREKTTFITEWGAFMYLVMPFGLCNAPATFQRCMMVIFADFLHKFLAIFVDDFTVYSQQQQHLLYLRMVFQRCREKRICLNPFKCVFCVWKGQLLGHIVSQQGMQMSADKVSDLINAKAPTFVTEVSSFLGYANFYRRFVEHFAAIAIPLYELTQKDVPFTWTAECQKAFEQLKATIASEPILRQPNWDTIFHVHVDASGIALGSILAQPDGKMDFPVYFASRRFSKAEQGYSTTEREALGMVFSVQKFRHYLLGKLFHFYVDHQALLYLINKVLIQGRLMRWMLFLQEYDFKIFHKPGKYHHGADFLSRSAEGDHEQSIRDEPPDAELFLTCLENEDPKWLDIRIFLTTGRVPEGLNTSERKAFILKTLKFTMIEQALYRLGRDGILRRCVPRSARQQVTEEAHAGDAGGHFAAEITIKKILQVGLWWESMQPDVITYCRKCDICQQTGRPTASDMMPRVNIVPLEAFMKWGLDFMGPFKKVTQRKNQYIIVATDYVTKWAEAKALPDNTAKSTAWFLFDQVIARFGCPLEIVSDQGTHFMNEIIENLTHTFMIKHRKSTPYYPRCNGQAESTNKTLKGILTKIVQDAPHDWDRKLVSPYGPIEQLLRSQPIKLHSGWLMARRQLCHWSLWCQVYALQWIMTWIIMPY